MKKLLFLMIFGAVLMFQSNAQQKKSLNEKKAQKESQSEIKNYADQKESVVEKATSLESKDEPKKNMDANASINQIDVTVGNPGEERIAMSFDEVYANFKEKVQSIESEINEKKIGIQKDNSLSPELKQKKVEEYNAYRKQLLVEIFGQKNFELYEKSLKH